MPNDIQHLPEQRADVLLERISDSLYNLCLKAMSRDIAYSFCVGDDSNRRLAACDLQTSRKFGTLTLASPIFLLHH
ncbi:MAG: hypothetical protein HY033_01945 [Ignavibacteriae bacterium]|nr:hypothetical protein [Ignavibacteria bacterium]MBI3363649.1 hypothetical protein [Ignavibacteriota bacterium]